MLKLLYFVLCSSVNIHILEWHIHSRHGAHMRMVKEKRQYVICLYACYCHCFKISIECIYCIFCTYSYMMLMMYFALCFIGSHLMLLLFIEHQNNTLLVHVYYIKNVSICHFCLFFWGCFFYINRECFGTLLLHI